jgi:hypothetical protein
MTASIACHAAIIARWLLCPRRGFGPAFLDWRE